MHYRFSRSDTDRRPRHTQRGAVFLLSCYLVSFSLFVLMTVMFARSANEIRLAEYSAKLAQAFWGAEAAMDAAIEALKTQPEPTLALNECTGTQATKVTGATYRLCLEAQDVSTGTSRYRIEATGTQNSVRETLTAQVNRQTDTVQFNRVVSTTGNITYRNGLTGGMNTSRSRLIANTTFRGDLASQVASGGFGGAISLQNSQVQGNAYVGPGGDPATLISLGGSRLNPSLITSTITGSVGTLSNPLPALPKVTVPSSAVKLGNRYGNLQVGGQVYGPGCYYGCLNEPRRCLEPGTYQVHHLMIGAIWSGYGIDDIDGYNNAHPDHISMGTQRGELCTTGPVDLYVTGKLQVVYGELYGQPAGSRPFDKQYSPQDLRLFFVDESGPGTNRSIDLGILGSAILVGTVYGPTHGFTMTGLNGRFLGGAILNSVFMWGAGAGFGWGEGGGMPGGSSSDFWTLYDEQLRNRPFQVGPAKVTTLMWGRGSQLAAATPTTPTTTTPPGTTTTTPPATTTTWSVICTEMHRQGFLPEAWYAADAAFGARLEPATLTVYQSWATPVVGAMQRSKLVTALVKPFAYAWAQHMAYEMGVSPTDSPLGAALNAVGLPLHRTLGKLLVRTLTTVATP